MDSNIKERGMHHAQRARLETTVSKAHRVVYDAAELAHNQGLFGTEQDLWQIAGELMRVGTALINKRNPKSQVNVVEQLRIR